MVARGFQSASHPILAQILAAVPAPPPPVGPPTPVPPLVMSTVYIERALINPTGNDEGREVVVLSSLATTAQTLSNWRLVDKNARVTPINTTIGPGQSVLIALDGTGVQLGNQGGNPHAFRVGAAYCPQRPAVASPRTFTRNVIGSS